MQPEDKGLAGAAASLTVDDFRYLQEHGMIGVPAAPSNPNTQVTVTHEDAHSGVSGQSRRKKRHTRRTVTHTWPEVGTTLEADSSQVPQHFCKYRLRIRGV